MVSTCRVARCAHTSTYCGSRRMRRLWTLRRLTAMCGAVRPCCSASTLSPNFLWVATPPASPGASVLFRFLFLFFKLLSHRRAGGPPAGPLSGRHPPPTPARVGPVGALPPAPRRGCRRRRAGGRLHHRPARQPRCGDLPAERLRHGAGAHVRGCPRGGPLLQRPRGGGVAHPHRPGRGGGRRGGRGRQRGRQGR